MATKNNETQLSPKQMLAAQMLALGRGVEETAEALGVNRTTIWEWKQDPAFVAVINRLQQELWEEVFNKYKTVLCKALAVLDKALDAGNVKAALKVIETAKLDELLAKHYQQTASAPTDPETVAQRQAEKAAWSELVGELSLLRA
ncbi:MAG: phBC6A51 family helix-turn-helix protein [Thermacetogeniaceae bacterium]